VENFDFGIKLSGAPSLIVFIGLEGIALLPEDIEIRKVGSVIHKCDVVTLSTLRFDWCRTP